MGLKQCTREGADLMYMSIFSMIRYINSNLSMKQCIDGCSRVALGNFFGGNMFLVDNRVNSGNTRAAATEYLAPIQTAHKEKSKKD